MWQITIHSLWLPYDLELLVTQGPSEYAFSQGHTIELDGRQLFDNTLWDDKKDLICGVYEPEYVTFSWTYNLANCLIKVMVIRWNVCPGGHSNPFSSIQAHRLDIGPHTVKPGSNTTWGRLMNIALNCGIQWGGQRVWSPSAEHLGNSEKLFIWLLSHIFLKFCSWYCLIFHFCNLSITYILANVVFNFVHCHMQLLSCKYLCLLFFLNEIYQMKKLFYLNINLLSRR